MSSDKHLIWRINHGSRKAADELFGRYYREIFAYIYKQCGEYELAMDLTQDTFVAAFRGIQGYDERKAQFRTWLYRIAANKTADYYRSKQYSQHIAEQSIDDSTFEIPDDADVLKSLAQRDTIKQIMEIVFGYELVWIHIFQMKIFEGITFSQIAEALDLSENTVKTRYYAMIKKIRKELSE